MLKLGTDKYLFSFTHQTLKVPPLQECYLIYPDLDRSGLPDAVCLGFLEQVDLQSSEVRKNNFPERAVKVKRKL